MVPARGHRPERPHHQTHRRTDQPQEHRPLSPLRPATPHRRSTPERLSGSSSTAGRAADGECVSMPNPVNVKVGDGREISAGRARLMSVDVGGRIDLLTAPERDACRERWRDGCLGPR